MASLPPSEQNSGRRGDGRQANPQPSTPTTIPGSSRPDQSLGTETVLLNDPRAGVSSLDNPPPGAQLDIRRCWICQGDETEEAPGTSIWRKPCPCSLVAHDECLLEWIADAEAPKPGELASPHQIVCPQCKAEIKIERPQDLVVTMFDRAQTLATACILPTALSGIVGCCYSGLVVYGFNIIHIVFGPEDASRLLASMRGTQYTHRTSLMQWLDTLISNTDPFLPGLGAISNWKAWLTLPLIGPGLVLLRTKMADYTFPLLMPLYFLNHSHQNIYDWPPSPGLTFATIPYLRTAYSELYRYAFADLEKKWDMAVQRKPREGETAEQIARNADNEEGRAIFELEIVQEIEEERFPPARVAGNDARNEGQAAGIEQGQAGNAHEDVAAEGPQGGQARNNEGWEFRQDISTAHIATTVMGALFFPAISSLMGDLLYRLLPAKSVGRGIGVRLAGRGLLKEKWGRTVIGGCLFVVLKDVVTLYCKWKKARDFGKRRVLDYVGPPRIR
ncbi:uncharacterized protein BP5553_02137 [Venustampulla echinocandica]|uniref:RING-CH-type domain-containing protein n=1 Tax=Venustampulla echinocandica TaxID=2656787 RepID=A0A370U304_9HELO|nr:uncharacterized protein BP5553_02137 [Venustampulla echinocandica]RDL42158.1 hypothetical protein BP5553_02137 [Venustampulla echinocandica]